MMDGSRAPFSVSTASWLTNILSLSDTQKRSWDDLVQVAQGRPESLMRAGGTGNCRSRAWHVNQCKDDWLLDGVSRLTPEGGHSHFSHGNSSKTSH